MLTSNWQQVVYRNFRFIREMREFDRPDLLQMVQQIQYILDTEDDEPIQSVYESSLWGLCQAYREFTGNLPRSMSETEFDYIRRRGGMLGMYFDENDNIISVSLSEVLSHFDPAFGVWLSQNQYGPPAF